MQRLFKSSWTGFVTTTADEQRCKNGIKPIPLQSIIPKDPILERARYEGLSADIDLGHNDVARAVIECLNPIIKNRQKRFLDKDHFRYLPIFNLFLKGNGFYEFSKRLHFHWKLVRALGAVGILVVVSALGLTSFETLFNPSDMANRDQINSWLIAAVTIGCIGITFLAGRMWLGRTMKWKMAMLHSMEEEKEKTVLESLPNIAMKMLELERKTARFARKIWRWIEENQNAERRKR